ncbi:MAG: hypothetical protein WDW38_008482 [Sanguina aurantia]
MGNATTPRILARQRLGNMDCCKPFHQPNTSVVPATPEASLRARFSAYSKKLHKYILRTTHSQNPSRSGSDSADKLKHTTFEEDVKVSMLNADFRSLTLLGSSQEEGPDSATLDFEIVFRLNISNDGKKLGTPVEKTLRESSKFVREDGEWLCLRSVSSDWDRHTMDAPAAAEQELPDDVDDILEILAAEAAPLNLWLDCARGYLLQGRVDAFQQICSEATRVEVAQEVQRLFGAPPTYEQIQFHCASAGLHMAQAKEEKAPVKRTQLLAAAAQDLAKAQALDSGEQIVILGQGLLHVARGNEIPQARRELARAMVAKNHGRANVLPHLALAALMFSQQQYKEAHSIYCRALREHPGCPAEVRLGIAACRYRLGDPAGATAAYERVLDLDPTSADAMVGLATIKFNAQDVQQGLADGLKLLSRAYQLQPNHANRIDPAAPLPHLGMAQLLGALCPSNPTKVASTTEAFKEAAVKRPTDPEIWAVLGELTAATDPSGSLAAYKKALALQRAQHTHVVAAEEAAAAERREHRQAKEDRAPTEGGGMFGSDSDDDTAEEVLAAATVASAARVAAAVVPRKLLNNAAVLLYSERQRSGSGPAGVLGTLTSRFNAARVREASGDLKRATAEYNGILADCPGYTDCYLRLACISRAKGDHAAAVAWAQRAVEFEGGHADAHALMAELHMERREWDKADMHLKKLVQDTSSSGSGGNKKDLYAKLASATLLLGSAPHITKRKGDEAGRRAQERYAKVCEDYRSLLASQPSNVYAANGIGATLAEMGHLEEAGAVFGEVVAAVAASNGFLQVPDVLLNQANVALANQQYASAIRLYQIALEKGRDDNRTQILLYLARAHYDSDDLRSAKSCLVRAIHLAPTDYKLRFNAALTMQEWAVRVYRKKRPAADPTKIAEFTSAADDLRSAIKFFVHLKQLGKERSRMEDTKLDAHVAFCRDQVAKAAQYILAAEGEAETNGLRRMEQNKLLEAAEQSRQSEMLRKKADERAAKDDNERRAQEARSKLADLQQRWQSARGSDNFVEAEGDAPAAASGAPSGATKKPSGKKGEKASGGKKKSKKAAAGGGGGGKKSKSQRASAGKGKKSKGRAEQEDSEDEGADSDAEGGRVTRGLQRRRRRRGLASAYQAAGLESSEEGNDESRPSRSQPDAAADGDGMDGLEDDDAELADDSQGPSPGKSGSGSAAQRKRQRAALEDEESDEERAGPPEKAAGRGMDEMQDLFGSEDEEEERAGGGGGGEAEAGGAAEGQMDDMLEDN